MFEKMKGFVSGVKEKTNAKMLAAPALAAGVAAVSSVTAFAVDDTTVSKLPTVAITEDMLSPLVEGVVANIGVILPIGLGLFAIMIGIRIISGLINRFLRG